MISGAQNDKPYLAEWTSGYDQIVDDFKKKQLPMPGVPADQASPVAMLIVNAMLLTGFDAPPRSGALPGQGAGRYEPPPSTSPTW